MKTSLSHNNKVSKILSLETYIFIVFCIASLFIFYISLNFIVLSLEWNLFLSMIPFILSNFFDKSHKYMRWLLLLLWILFIPNAFYMMTDLIHIQSLNIIINPTPYSQYYSTDVILWILMLYIISISIFGVYLGLKSVDEFLNMIGEKLRLISLLILSMMIGVGMTIGRFLRLNSWNAFNPIELLTTIFNGFDIVMIRLSILFSIVVFILIFMYSYKRLIKKEVKEHEKNSNMR